jgi:hypothetical protein
MKEVSRKFKPYWSIASISLPNAKVGSVIEFKYTITSHIVKFPVYENQYIPLNYSEYNTEVPDFLFINTSNRSYKNRTDSKFTSGSQSFDNKYGANIINYKQITSLRH